MRTFLFIFLVVVVQVLRVYSQPVSLKEAEQTAQNFFGKTHKSVPTCADMSINGLDTLFYVFNGDNAFVVISADKKAIPILAYSTESSYDADNVITPVKMWLYSYQRKLLAIRKDETFSQSMSVCKAWEELQQPTKIRKSTTSASTPLLTSKWGQGKIYNYYCPKDANGPNGRVVTGCVATAMAQLMYYFRFPSQGTGSYEYTWEPYGKLFADFGSAVYNYSAMIDKPTDVNPAICSLMYHCGVAVDMEYGPNGSGMTNHSAANQLIKHFNFSPKTQYVFRDTVTVLNWDSLIISHIDNNIPLYYAGWGDTSYIMGHAFICDAYQIDSNNNHYYHFNFGWEGQSDGYFYTDSLYVNKNNFTLRQELIINAYPDTLKFKYPYPLPLIGTTVLTIETGSFTTGTINDCPPNMDYTWIIRPDVDDIEKIAFDIRYKLAENDTVFVSYSNGNVRHIFTNDTSDFSANIIDTEVIIRLKTTNNVEFSGGISANYTTKRKIYCSGVKQFTAKQGTFDDGSGDSRYNNFTSCRWLISVTGVHSITIRFPKFETEKDKDILYIFDLAQSSRPILAKLSGTLTDSVYTFQTNQLAFTFETDEKNIFQGWTLFYDTDVVNISDFEKDNNKINIYPNPVNDNLFIEVNEPFIDEKIQLFDIYGRLLKEQSINEKQSQLNLSNIASGVYVAKIVEKNRILKIAKVVKK
jgi:hypothetical protein